MPLDHHLQHELEEIHLTIDRNQIVACPDKIACLGLTHFPQPRERKIHQRQLLY